MANMGGLSEQSEEDEEKELRQAFTVRHENSVQFLCQYLKCYWLIIFNNDLRSKRVSVMTYEYIER